MENVIHYGIGKEYLPNWTLKHALREIFQNFLDFGPYSVTTEFNDDLKLITITNDWKPENLNFLRIGNSKKDNIHAIGKHGEGLKMGFLILLRLGYGSKIITPTYEIYPDYYIDKEVGECFCFRYHHHYLKDQKYTIEFECDAYTYDDFVSGIITEKDVEFTEKNYGQIVNKPKGNIYSGKLFVASVANLSAAYNINPEHLPLDRDRMVPGAFDTNYSTSKIKEAYGKWTAQDTTYSDTSYISKIPDEVKKQFKPVMVNKSVEFVSKNELGETVVLQNDNIKRILKEDSFFQATIKKIKKYVAKKLGLYELLTEFEAKHARYLTSEGKEDLKAILERVNAK